MSKATIVVKGFSRTVGDVNLMLVCALVCAKIGVRVAHVEAGLRSFDPSTVPSVLGPEDQGLRTGPA